jgi:hypothetical protein
MSTINLSESKGRQAQQGKNGRKAHGNGVGNSESKMGLREGYFTGIYIL